MFAGDRRAIVEGAHVRDEARVVLSWQRANHIREHIVRQPSHTVVGGLACPHPVTRNGWVTTCAAGALACVIPHGEKGAARADRQIGLPIRTSSGISVQLERRAKGLPPIGRADIIDVTWIAAGPLLGIDVVNYAIDRGGLAPALVAPVATASAQQAREVAHTGDPNVQ